MIIGHLTRFLILNELNTKQFSHFSDCVEKLDIKCGGGGAEKIRRRLNRSFDDFDSMEIRLGKSAKFDGAGVYYLLLDQFRPSVRLSVRDKSEDCENGKRYAYG